MFVQLLLLRKRLVRQDSSHSGGFLGSLFVPGFVGLSRRVIVGGCLSRSESKVVDVFPYCVGPALDPVTIPMSVGDDPHGAHPFRFEPAPRMVPNEHQVPWLKLCDGRAWLYVSLLVSSLLVTGPLVALASRLLDGTVVPFPFAGATKVKAQEQVTGRLTGGGITAPSEIEKSFYKPAIPGLIGEHLASYAEDLFDLLVPPLRRVGPGVIVGGRPVFHLPAVTGPSENAAPELAAVVGYDGPRIPPPAEHFLLEDGGRHTGGRRFNRESLDPSGK
jgi:hypothetical protein